MISDITTLNNFQKNAIAVISASALTITQAQAFSVHSGYSNNDYKLEQISRISGSNVNVKRNIRQSQISLIKDFFALSDEELSNIVGVSRKTLYNWEKQGINKEKDRHRISKLSVIAEDWNYNQLPTAKDQLSKPILGSLSVMQMLMSKELDKEKIIFAGRRLAHHSLVYDTSLI